MSARRPHRWLVRYRMKADDKWQRKPRFITPITGYRTHAQANAALAKLVRNGYRGHVAAYDYLAILALAEAKKLVGVREHGGNNRGTKVMEIIRANGGTGPEPWCGDFVAWCYRRAGSEAVTRSWAAVRLLGSLSGMKRIGKRDAVPGDIVRFTFDHTGIVEHYCDSAGRKVGADRATHMATIEGNTGSDGAASDSAGGGDGVHRRRRSLALVKDCVMVLR